MTKKILIAAGGLASGFLLFVLQAQAAPIDGSQSKLENSSISPIPHFVQQDMSYDGSHPVRHIGFADLSTKWIGPTEGAGYYNPGEAPIPCADTETSPCGTDSPPQARLGLSGDMVVTGAGSGASISGTITIAAGERHWSCSQSSECNESWDSVTHTLASTVVDSASGPNAAGGFDYEIASKGVVPLLEPCVPYIAGSGIFPNGPFNCPQGGNFANQLFPSTTASIAYAPLFAWQNTGIAFGFPPGSTGPLQANGGLATFEGGGVCSIMFGPPAQGSKDACEFFGGTWTGNPNIGATTTAVATGYACEDSGEADSGTGGITPCNLGTSSSGLGQGGTFGYENLQLAVSTNAAGGIISVRGMYTHEYDTLPALGFPTIIHPDSWDGGVLEMSGFVAVSKGSDDNNAIQIDKKNILPITITGNADLDVHCIDPSSLAFGPGEFFTEETLGGLKHPRGHMNGNTFTGHFPSEDADLRCGVNDVRLRGMCSGVPFVTSVRVMGVGKACAD
jgi:hypothetical protein